MQNKKITNGHIEDYLDYYCKLSYSPSFAILLKGEWGAGKTWFINKYCDKLKERGQKYIYVSLYGLASLSDIDEQFFKLLHPILSSKGMAISSKILKGLLKLTFQIDLDSDKKNDVSWNVQIPDINLPDHLNNIDNSILIFDDLERCSIDIKNLLGYINYFVENHEMKVFIIANEDELAKTDSYKFIKEKLIGKTFNISPDFDKALTKFIDNIKDSKSKRFLLENSELVKDVFNRLCCKNLRILKQTVIDFDRIFSSLPDKIKSKPKLLNEILKTTITFSVEIRFGRLHPQEIYRLQDDFIKKQSDSIKSDLHNEETQKTSIYSELNLFNVFPSLKWWQTFFDQGSIDNQELEQSILNSNYFQDENQPDWIKLWHFSSLTDEDFNDLLNKIESDYINRNFCDIRIVKHIFGLFLLFSKAGLYPKSTQEILDSAKKYVDDFKSKDQVNELLKSLTSFSGSLIDDSGAFMGLGYQEKESSEFKEFNIYLNEVRTKENIDKLPIAAKKLLDIMKIDVFKFHRMICADTHSNQDICEHTYYDVPILKYISPQEFIDTLMQIERKDQRYIFWSICDRYKYENFHQDLIEELDWLKSIQTQLYKTANSKEGTVDGYCLKLLNEHYLDGLIKKVDKKKIQFETVNP